MSTAEELSGRRGLRMVAPNDCPSQAEYISYFGDAIAVMQTEPALERIAYEVCVDSAAENIDYLEVRWAPRLHMRKGLTVSEVIDAVLAGLAAAPLRAVAIVCAMRHHTVDDNAIWRHPEFEELESSFPIDPVEARAKEHGLQYVKLDGDVGIIGNGAGLRLTCHAGEAGDPANVAEALDLGVERIAHGVIGAREPRIVARIRSEGVVLDMCPTANWKCKAVATLQEHPLPDLVRSAVRCTISTDSRTVAATTLTHEFDLMSAMGMTDDELQRCNETAYESKFA